jgi:peroxiredoxin
MTILSLCSLLASVTVPSAPSSKAPAVGEVAKDFSLPGLDGKKFELGKLRKRGPVVLVVLRGWPGYQCPICSVQVGSFIARAQDFDARGASMVLVYPGPKERLDEHALEFVTGKSLPPTWHFLLDPNFSFINAYGLRWDAPKETAYPATFVIDRTGKVLFAQVSKGHGGRAKPEAVLETLPAPAKQP